MAWISNGDSGLDIRNRLNASAAADTLTADISMSSADILALGAAPQVLIAAPGANKVIQILDFAGFYTFVTTPYSNPDADVPIDIRYLGVDGDIGTFGSVLTETSSQFGSGFAAQEGAQYYPTASVVNKPVVLLAGAPPLLGDGTLRFIFHYRILDI